MCQICMATSASQHVASATDMSLESGPTSWWVLSCSIWAGFVLAQKGKLGRGDVLHLLWGICSASAFLHFILHVEPGFKVRRPHRLLHRAAPVPSVTYSCSVLITGLKGGRTTRLGKVQQQHGNCHSVSVLEASLGSAQDWQTTTKIV